MSLKRSSFSLENMVAPRGNLSLAPLGTWLFLKEQTYTFFYFKKLFSSISFMNEKENLRKRFETRTFGL
jgi:hypothetical protein